MKTTLLEFLAIACLAVACSNGSKTFTEAVNPLTYTDIPDNDLIRVGDVYYMVSTTMYFCPGAPVMRSEDLVHWRICGYIYDTLADDAIYRLEGGRNAYGKGQWATSIRYNDGWFYALFVANEYHKTFIFKTKDIENGPWERTDIDDAFYHDASMLWEDGKLYVVYGNGDLMLVELDPLTYKQKAAPELIVEAPREGMGLRAEGSHFYHIGDWYYILEIDWPAGGLRTETCWRSKDIKGPYESKTVLQGTMEDGYAAGVAQGGIVQTQYGDWYAIMFQDHGAVGRIPTVQPVKWEDGWPVMGDGGKPMKDVTVRLQPSGEDYVWADDDFDSGELAPVWQWNHMPADPLWSLGERPGYLRLRAGIPASGILEARNSLTQRTAGPACQSWVKLDLKGLENGDRAGICAFQSNNCCIGVEAAPDGTRNLVLREQTAGSGVRSERVVFSTPWQAGHIFLKITYKFQETADGDDLAFFSYSEDGVSWTQVRGYALRMKYTLDLFTGYRTALYCYNPSVAGGYADFDFFRQEII